MPRAPDRAVLALLCVAQFVDVLGVTVAVVALPVIAQDLDAAPSTVQWVVGGYALCFGGLLLLCGRVADLFGRRRLFVAGLVAFGAASLACGLAPTAGLLLAARGAQGAAAAAVVPAALALLASAFPAGEHRARALAAWTAAGAGGGAAGFRVGGLVTDALGWRWIFLLLAPIALAGAALAPRLLTEARADEAPALDVVGAVLGTAGLGATLAALTLAADRGPADPLTIVVLIAGCALLAAFAREQLRRRTPLVPPAVVRRRGVAGACAVAFALTATTGGAAVLVTGQVQEVLGRSAATAGMVFLPFSLLVVAGSLAGPRIVALVGGRRAAAAGLFAVALGMAFFALAGAAGGLAGLVAGLAVSGAGLGWASVAATGAGMAAAQEGEQGLVAGVLNTATQVGTAFGVAALGGVAAIPAVLEDGHRAGWLAALGLAVAAALATALARR